METTAIAPASTTLRTEQKSGLEGLGGDDFFKLLIAQLSNQDPLEPTSNQELLNQISSIRDIQSSITLTSTLESLVERQGFGSAASLIGQYVSGVTDATDGSSVPMRGIVMGLRITPEGSVMLLLDNGLELPMNKVEEVTTAQQFAEMLQGRMVHGIDRGDPANPEPVEGIVTGMTTDAGGQTVLELDNGRQTRLSDISVASSLKGAPPL